MELFDPFTSPIDGSFFIEASAGTGKTFSIEQITRRLVVEGQRPIEKIAVVTFTKKAAHELSCRVRKAVGQKAEVFTIHSFCRHWLSELSGYDVGLKSSYEERKEIVRHLLENELLRPAQMRRLVRRFKTSEALLDALLRLPCGTGDDLYGQLQERLRQLPDPGDLMDRFCSLANSYTKMVRRDGGLHEELMKKAQLCNEDPRDLERALDGDGPFFECFAPERLKKGKNAPDPHPFAPFIELLPLWKKVSDPFAILQYLKGELEQIEDPDREAKMNYDALLTRLDQKFDDPLALSRVKESLDLVIIDEFQDTDRVQWSLFSKLKAIGVRLIVVGDPKQSIYGFRKADIYTYFAAREQFDRRYSLGTSYRASFALTEQLNRLFAKRGGDFLWLPKSKRSEPFSPVKSAAPPKAEAAITLLVARVEKPSIEEQRRLLLPTVIEELLKLDDPSSAALLVRDRSQAALCLETLEKAGLSARADYEVEVRESCGYGAFRSFVDCEIDPGLFGLIDTDYQDGPPLFDRLEEVFSKILQIRAREGIASSLEAFLQIEWLGQPISSRISKELLAHLRSLASLYAEKMGPNFTWGAFERELCPISYGSGVIVTTIHKSKGLEYEHVFALGLIQRTPDLDAFIDGAPKKLVSADQIEAFGEEIDAEKLRQFYVALTRARSHLYVPLLIAQKSPRAKTASAMELFIGYCKSAHLTSRDMYSCLTDLSLDEAAALFEGSRRIDLTEKPPVKRECVNEISERLNYTCRGEETASFSSLALAHTGEITPAEPKEGELPVGTQTGIIVHEVIRRAFVTGAYRNFTLSDLERLGQGLCQPHFLMEWKEELFSLIATAFNLFDLRQAHPKDLMAEVPFLYDRGDVWMKGYIDLMVHVGGKLLIIDWKTNWLPSYEESSLRAAILAHRYDMQAALYKNAVERLRLPWEVEGVETHYAFLRGGVTINVESDTLPVVS